MGLFIYLCFIQLFIVGAVSQVTLNCHNACPGTQYIISCSATSDFLYQKMHIKSDDCDAEFDITANIKGDKCGSFNLNISKTSTRKTIDVHFKATKHLNNATVVCLGQKKSGFVTESCSISLAETPNPPTNIKIRDLNSPSVILATWNEPSMLRGQVDRNLSYHVTTNSSLDGLKQFHTYANCHMWPNEKASNETISYEICVSAENCAGMSDPICDKRVVVPIKAPMSLDSTILNSSSVEISWMHRNDENITCVDIERNFIIINHCIKGKSIIVNVEGTVKVHMFRVRAIVLGMPGEWSDPECVVLAVPFPLKLSNYVVSTLGETKTIILTLRQENQSQFVGNCKVPKVEHVHLSSELMSFRHTVAEGTLEHNVSFIFNQSAMHSKDVHKIAVKAMSATGSSPEQFYYIPVDELGINSAQSKSSFSFILMILLSIAIHQTINYF